MSLFDNTPPPELDPRDSKRPLAERMRPERLEDYIGQEHVLGTGKPLRRQIERDAHHTAVGGAARSSRPIVSNNSRHFGNREYTISSNSGVSVI